MTDLFVASLVGIGCGFWTWRRLRRPVLPVSRLRRDEDRMSPSWIVENVYRSGQGGDRGAA